MKRRLFRPLIVMEATAGPHVIQSGKRDDDDDDDDTALRPRHRLETQPSADSNAVAFTMGKPVRELFPSLRYGSLHSAFFSIISTLSDLSSTISSRYVIVLALA